MPTDLPAELGSAARGLRGTIGARPRAHREKIFTTPLVGIAIYLFVIHSYQLPIAGFAVGLALIGLVMEGRALQVPSFLVWFGAWLIWGLLSLVWSNFPALGWEAFVEFSKVWLIVFVAVNAIRTPVQLFAFAVTWLGMFALYPVRGTLFNIMFGHSTQGRFAWNFAFANPNAMAAYTLLLLALSVAVFRVAQVRWVRLAALAGIFILPLIMFFTQSRGGFLGLAIFTLLVFAGERAKFKLLAIGVAAAGLIVLTAPASVWERIGGMKNLTSTETLSAADDFSSAEQRWVIWQVAGKIIAAHPLGGVGLGAYPEEHFLMVRRNTYFLGFAWGRRDTHSTYLNVAAETGVVGSALFIAMLLSALGAGRRAHRRLRQTSGALKDLQALVALRAGLLGFMVCGIFGGLHREPQLYFMMTVIVHYSALLLKAHAAESPRALTGRAIPRATRRRA